MGLARALQGVDTGTPSAGPTIVAGLKGAQVDLAVVVAGVLKPETFEDGPKWDDEELMFRVCAIGPTFVASALCVDPFLPLPCLALRARAQRH